MNDRAKVIRYEEAIRKNCVQCVGSKQAVLQCTNNKCEFINLRYPVFQIDLFDQHGKDKFFLMAREFINNHFAAMFLWSDFRRGFELKLQEACVIPHKNWWGTIPEILKKDGWKRDVSHISCSPITKSDEFQYIRI